jgi:hypothetical protein
MRNLQRRLKKLEAALTDQTGLVPHSAAWMKYWTEELEKFVASGDPGPKMRIPLEGARAYLQAARDTGYR